MNNLTTRTLEDELVRIIDTYSDERGWINDEQFCVWVPWIEVYDFLTDMRETFGLTIFDDCGTDANIQDRFICFDMTDFLSGQGYIVEDTYPKEDYRH